MSDNSFKPRVITAAIFACAVSFFAYAVLTRLHETFDENVRPAKRFVVKPFNEQPMEDATREFQRFEFDVVTKQHRRNYSYYFYTPFLAEHTEKRKFPLVMVLHNGKGYAYAAKYLAMGRVIYDHPAFILVPMLDDKMTWAMPPTTSYLHQIPIDQLTISDMVLIIRRLTEIYPIDTSRIYVTGCSAGAVGTYAAARYYPDVFAAAIPISGIWNLNDAPNMTKVPLWIEHGAADKTVPAHGDFELEHAINDNGGSAMYTEFPDVGHECSWESFYNKSIFDWMFKQSRKTN